MLSMTDEGVPKTHSLRLLSLTRLPLAGTLSRKRERENQPPSHSGTHPPLAPVTLPQGMIRFNVVSTSLRIGSHACVAFFLGLRARACFECYGFR